MKMKYSTATVPFLLLIILFITTQAARTPPPHQTCSTTTPTSPSTLEIIQVSSPCSPFTSKPTTQTFTSSLLQTQSEDTARLLFLTSLIAGKSPVPIAWGRNLIQTPTYLVKVNIGTPPQTLIMALDTSTDTAFLPCTGCVGCPSSSVTFTPAKSTSFKSVSCTSTQCAQNTGTCPASGGKSCSFNHTYGGTTLASSLSTDTLTLATDHVPHYNFACVQQSSGPGAGSLPPQGVLGLGRGPMSLMSQTQSLYKATFSYCLPSFKTPNFSGSLRLGTYGQPKRIKTTPLLVNPKRPSLYYVNLIGIKVGAKTVAIPPSALAFNPATGAGTIFDSGTVYTRLVPAAYTAVRDEFRRRMSSANMTTLGGFDTCYAAKITVPSIAFVFDTMRVTLPPDNFLIRSSASSISCLAIASTTMSDGINVIGSMQQQNHRVFFDVVNNRLGVARENCS